MATTEKISVSLPAELVAEARRLTGGGNLSAFITEGLRRSILAERQHRYLEEWVSEHGPIPDEAMAEMAALWPD